MLGQHNCAKLFDGNQHMLMKYLYQDLLLIKRQEIQEYILNDKNSSVRLVRATMILRALTFNKHITEDNFESSIKPLLEVALKSVQLALEGIAPEDQDVKIVTYANLIEALTFQAHPSTIREKIQQFVLTQD